MVTDEQIAVENQSVSEFVGVPMRSGLVVCAEAKEPITATVFAASPQPASLGLLYKGPEAFMCWQGFPKAWSHAPMHAMVGLRTWLGTESPQSSGDVAWSNMEHLGALLADNVRHGALPLSPYGVCGNSVGCRAFGSEPSHWRSIA
jgi:hypothetical protein